MSEGRRFHLHHGNNVEAATEQGVSNGEAALEGAAINESDNNATGNPYASANKWRHQESSKFGRYEAETAGSSDGGGHSDTKDLRDFLNASRMTPEEAKAAAGAQGPTSAPVAAVSAPDHGNEPGKAVPIVAATNGAGAGVSAGAVAGAGAGAAAVAGANAEAEADAAAHDGTGRLVGTVAAKASSATMEGASPPTTEIIAGPLINYRRMEEGRWIGSVLVVTRGGGKAEVPAPTLVLQQADGESQGPEHPVRGYRLFSDPRNTFWRFDLSVPMGDVQSRWQYTLPTLQQTLPQKPATNYFFVPAITENMRILFFSCNGFSVGTDEDAWCGPALWNDVARCHHKTPFHVMIGGGDQIYNDSIRVSGPLREWTAIGNPKKRREFPYPEAMRAACDAFYLKNYIRWYTTEPFATSNGQIPQLNIWDDHDIIDGFGSYVNEFMRCDVFRGIGGSAHKYYMLFQHHLPPPPSTYVSDLPQSDNSQTIDPRQLVDTYVAPPIVEPNYIIGSKPGPYVAEHSHNMYAKLGARMAFLGVDARTERTRHQVNYPTTYDQIFKRVKQEFTAAAAAGEPVRHLILLLGIPIAYPRLTWLENVFNSPVMGPVKFMNRRFGFGGGFFNYFDGSVDLLDDLDDHYTARTHKKERNWFIEQLQHISADHSVRITILGGDVHLAALGRFYANPHLGIPTENDYRFMINIVSSAITNKPPPAAIANLLSRRNRIHHLNNTTDETLFKLFDKDPGNSNKTASSNHVTMPSRNFAIITENSPHNSGAAAAASASAAASAQQAAVADGNLRSHSAVDVSNTEAAPPRSSAGVSVSGTSTKSHGVANGKNGHHPLHAGEEGAGTKHKAANDDLHGMGNDGSLDVCIKVEINQHDPQGRTEGYGLTIPALDYNTPPPVPEIPKHFRLHHSGQPASQAATASA